MTRYVDVLKFPSDGTGRRTLLRLLGDSFPGLRDFDTGGHVSEYEARAVVGDNLVLVAEDPRGKGYRVYLINLVTNQASLVRYQDP